MYRVDLMRTSYGQYLRLLTFTKNYNYGDAMSITVELCDINTKIREIVGGDDLYELIYNNQIVFGVRVMDVDALACTLCSEIAASVYKDFAYNGTFSGDAFLEMITQSNREKAEEWLHSGTLITFDNKYGLENGIIDLDNMTLNSPNGISYYSTMRDEKTAKENSLTNLLDYLISTKNSDSDLFIDNKKFFLKEKLGRGGYRVHCYLMSSKLLLELM